MPNLKNKKVIKDQQGQRKYPGRVTKIQGDTMATTGYGDIPLYVVPNVGNPMVVPANSGNIVFPGASSFTEYPIANNSGWLEKYQVGGKKGKKQGNPVSDWFYNTEDVQGTYKMASDLDPFLKNWLKNPETQKRLKDNLASSVLTKDQDSKKLTDQAISRLDNLPMFSRELVKKSGITSRDIENNNELQGWKTPSSIGNNPYYEGDKQNELGVYMPDYHVSMVNNFNSPGVITHEQTHATGPFQKNMERVIFDKYFFKKNDSDKKFIKDFSHNTYDYNSIYEPIEKLKQKYPAIYDDYKKHQEYLDEDGMYPRIMDIRRSLNIKSGQKVNKSILENKTILGPVDDLRNYYDDDTIIDMLNTLAKSNNAKNLPTAEHGGWLDTYQVGGNTYGDSLMLYNKGLQDIKKRGSNNLVKIWNANDPLLSDLSYNQGKIKPITINQYSGGYDGAGTSFIPQYKKPIIKPYLRHLMTAKDWQDVNSNDYKSEEAKIKNVDTNKFDIYRTSASTFDIRPKKQIKIKPKLEVKPVEKIVKTETVNLAEPIKTQAINVPNLINEDRTEVNFGQKYKTYVYKGEKNPRYKDPTTGKDLDPDISKSVDAKGNYNPVYLEQKEYGGWLDTYQVGGKTDPSVNLRSASTPLTSAVSTQAPKVKLNKTGFDWAWENANKVTTKEGPTIQMMYNEGIDNKESSNSNFFLPDKYGKYVDSGVSPFDLMFATSKAVPSALAKITNKIEKAGTAAAPYIKKALSTKLPGMANVSGATFGNAIGSMFIGHGAAHITPDAIEMYKNPSWSNAGNLAMDIAEISPLIGPTSKVIGKGLNAAGKYLTEETALQNAWKLNSKAFKENPEAYYRGIGEKGLKNAQETNLIGSKTPQVYTSPYFAKQGDFKIAQHFNPDVIVEAKGKSLYDDLTNLNKDDLVFTRSNMGSVPLKHSSLSKVTPGVNLEGDLADIGLEGISLNNPNIRVLKKDWWQRYKPIEFNKNTPSSSNVNKVDDVAINLESQIANLKQQQVLTQEYVQTLMSDYKAGKISAEEYKSLYKELNPNKLLNSRIELEKILNEYKVKQDIANTPQQNILKSEEQLGKNLVLSEPYYIKGTSKGGTTNTRGVFELGDNHVARLSAWGYDDASRLVNYADKIKSPRIAKTVQVKEINGKVYQVQQKVTGTSIASLTETELQNIPKEHINNFWKDKAELENLGLSIDISGNKPNILYNPKKGFQFIDLGIVSKDGQNMMESNEVFAQTYKGLKLPGSSNAVSSSEDVVQQLRNELSEKGIISQQKTLNLPWKEPIRKGVEPWGYGNDNASLLPITGSKFKDVKGAIVGGKNPSYLSDKEYLMKSGNYDAKLRKANDLLIKEGKDPVYDDDMKELLKNKPVLSNEKNIKDAINLRDKIKYTYEESKYRISPDNTYLNESFTKNQRNRYATWDMYLGKPQKEHSMYDISELTKSKKDVIYTIKEDFMNKHAIQRKFDSFFKDIDNEKFAGSKIESSWKQKDNSFIIPDTDNNMFGTMGGFHWKLEKMADGNFKAIANDVWDLQPFKNSKLPKVIRNLEVGKTLGIGKPLNVKVGFILDGKTKKIIKTFGLGGTVLQTAASQNKQDNSQWLNKYK